MTVGDRWPTCAAATRDHDAAWACCQTGAQRHTACAPPLLPAQPSRQQSVTVWGPRARAQGAHCAAQASAALSAGQLPGPHGPSPHLLLVVPDPDAGHDSNWKQPRNHVLLALPQAATRHLAECQGAWDCTGLWPWWPAATALAGNPGSSTTGSGPRSDGAARATAIYFQLSTLRFVVYELATETQGTSPPPRRRGIGTVNDAVHLKWHRQLVGQNGQKSYKVAIQWIKFVFVERTLALVATHAGSCLLCGQQALRHGRACRSRGSTRALGSTGSLC